jgi:hypothetical protein
MKGLLYFAQNSAFQHLTKIGKTSKLDVEDRGLSASNVPEDFNYLAVFVCEDIDWAEKKVHEQFSGYRHFSANCRRTEFFWSGCIKDAIKYANDLKGVKNTTQKETDTIETINESGEKEIKRIPQTTFEMIGVKKGEKIFYKNDNKFVAIVEDNKNQITYNSKTASISTVALEIAQQQGGKLTNVNGFLYFYKDGKTLFSMRPDQQK